MKNVLRKVFAALRYTKPSEQSWKRCRSAIAIVLVFITTYVMVMPAIALEGENVSNFAGLDLADQSANDLNCSFDVHKHTEECCKEVPVFDANGNQTGTKKVLHCGKEDWVVHEHDENCYQDGKLVCKLPEHKEHQHDAKCYTTQRVLSCPKEEKQGHKHTDACFEEIKELACGQKEHVHTEACYSEREDNGENAEPQLVCGQEEHVHSDECYSTEKKLICGKEEEEGHTHTDACYTEKEVLTCKELTPHTHDLDCYEKGPDGESAAEMGWVQLKDENDPNCKEVVYGDPDHLICGKTELLVHQHGEECFGEAEDDVNTEELQSDAEEAEPQDDTAIEDLQIVTDDGAETESETDNVTDAEAEAETGEEDASLIKLHSENAGESEDSDSSEDAQDKQDINTRTVEVDGASYSLVITYPTESNIPENAEFRATAIADTRTDYEAYRDRAFAAVDSYNAEAEERSRAQEMPGLFDLTIFDEEGNEIQPDAPLQISIDLGAESAVEAEDNTEKPAGIFAVHFPGTGVDTVMKPAATNPVEMAAQKVAERIAGTGPEVIETTDGEDGTVQFEAESLSVYAIVYTVDFHWEVDGKEYSFSIPGGGFVSLQKLVEILGIADENANEVVKDDSAEMQDAEGVQEAESAQKEEPAQDKVGAVQEKEASALTLESVQVSEDTKKFLVDVEKVEFSNPDLVWVGKVEEETTVGALKETNGLDVEYSAELTKKQIKEINAQTVEGGDWALISVQPFTTEEMLTVTMKDGEQFVVKVTDAQDPSIFLGKEVIIYDNTEKQAMTSNYATDYRTHFNTTPEATADNDTSAHWKIVRANDGYYLQSNEGKYLYLDHTNVSLVDNTSQATVLTIQAGRNPDYRIYAANNNNNALRYCENNQYDGFFSAVDGTNGAGTSREWLYIREAAKAVEPAGDWLLYFDDDFSEITIHVGETITLRPYSKWEWKEGSTDVQTAHWNVGGSAWSDWSISGSDANGSKLSKATDGPFEFTRYVKHDDQLTTHYWSVQGRATQTGDYTLTNTKNGKTITVHVVDGEPVNQPNTINNIANIKVNLFDYDKNYLLDPSDNTNLANNNNNKTDSTNKMGGSDHFYFLSSGSGDNSDEPWNSYTKDKSNPDIVKDALDSEGYPVLNHGKQTSLKYLFDTSQTSWHGGNYNDGMIAYPDVVGMFQKDSEGYYYYNSNTNYYYYDTATGTSKLYEHTYTQTSGKSKGALVNDKPIGFFPFHDYDSTSNLYVNQNHNLNHHVGMSMEVEFMLPNNRLDDNGKPIIFDFSGDDDLWVFVEWVDDNGVKHSKRMLDLGGVHQPIHGEINFTNDTSIEAHKPYTLKVFYLERGGCDSNCSIRFNLPIIQDLTVAKKLTGLTEAEKAKYKDEEFTYEIVVNGQPYTGPNGPEKIVIRNAAGEDITPENFRITNGQVKIKDGQALTISYLDRSDTFSVAEVNTPNMENFETPNAERYYHLEHDASLYEEEIALTARKAQNDSKLIDWTTPTYDLEDTEKVTFTNTLKEKNLEVDKKWKGEKDPPESIAFTVSATVDDGNGGRTPYAVSELKEADGTTDKVFILSKSNKWRYEIENLPVNTPDGKFIFYDIIEGQVEGYTLTGLKDITADKYNYCNVDVVKLWPDSNAEHTEVIEVVLKNSAGKYYAGIDDKGEAKFVDDVSEAKSYNLTNANNYTHRFERVPAGEYTAEQLHEDVHTKGLATYVRNIIQYELENSPIEKPVGPDDQPNTPEIHKRIDALRDGTVNPDSPHMGEDLTDLYRLYLDYKVKSLQEANGVDLLFVIDHSGSMNNTAWQGNPYRAPAVEAALNGSDGLISEFLNMNEKNQWAAVGFKGPDGAKDYYWSMGNPWQPATEKSAYNAGINGSEILSSGGESYVFTRNDASPTGKNVELDDEGANILTNYTAGLWRAEQFLLKNDVKKDGRKKVIVFISDGIPTLHIDCPSGTLQGAGTADGSPYYRDAYGGCPTQTLTEFGYFVNDMKGNGYTFGGNMEFYTIGFGGTMQTESGSQLLNGMLDTAYGEGKHSGHFMTISDVSYNPWDDSTATENLKNNLRKIMGMNETFTNIVIQDDLSSYVDLYGLADAGTNASDIMRAAKAKATMKIPNPDDADKPQIITLYENGAPVNSDDAKFTRADGTTKANIIQKLEYDADTKTVKAVFDPEYKVVAGAVYTLSFDVKTTDTAYTKYAESGYDKYTEGEKQGKTIIGDLDTDFLGTDPDNATSVNKPGFRSNDEAKATYKHNGKDEELEYPHPVIQVAAKVDIVKIDQTGAALEGAKFNLYNDKYDAKKTIEQNAGCLIEANLQSKKPTDPAGNDAVIRSGKLGAGTYYLVETETPAGYISLSGPVKITVTETNGVFSMTAEIAGVSVGNDKLAKSDNGWKLSIQNSAGYELPYTGGTGTKTIHLTGLLLLVFAGIGLMMRRRYRC